MSYLTGDSGVGIVSQNLEPGLDAYDAVAADDFEVARRCRARVITVAGTYFSGVGPARSETVTFYRDADGRPGRTIRSETVVGDDSQGTFDIAFERALRLRPGRTYWVSTVANQDFSCCGTWGVETRAPLEGHPPVWKNPGDGFASGCTDWDDLVQCLQREEEIGGLMFEIRTR